MTSNERNWDDPEYKKWRLSVRRRDKECQWPNCCHKNEKLQTHHIRKWATYPTLRYDIDNGITLCKFHHTFIKGHEDNYIGMFLNILLSKERLRGQAKQGGKRGRRKNTD